MKLGILAALAGSLLFPQAVNAGVFGINSNDLGLSATITTSNSPGASGGYDIIGITGAVNGFGNIDGMIDIADRVLNPNPPGTYLADFGILGNLVSYDNLFFTTVPHFDAFGVVFHLSSGNLAVLGCTGSGACSGGNYELLVGNIATDRIGSIDVTTITEIPAVPEASKWSMIIIGFVGLGFIFRGRANRSSLTTA